LLLDQRRRWQNDERVLLETYLQEYPSLQVETDELLELLYHEVVLREEQDERPSLEEYQRRFPEHAEAIRLQFEIHAALRPPDEWDSEGTPAGNNLPSVRGYEVLELLGRGGMGVVYKARQIALNRLVALKMVATGAETRLEERLRFRREAEAIASLQHPHIVQIYEVGVQDQCLFLALEYADGGTLTDHLEGTPWPARRAVGLVEPLARAMHHAHQRGIVHRDLKPANILLQRIDQEAGREGEKESGNPNHAGRTPISMSPKIADFGLAKLLQAGPAGLTQTGDILGTPSYMSPEQVEAGGSRSCKGRTISPATDVYGLGAVLYEVLTGRPPFRGETPLATCQQILHTEPVPPSHLQPACPRDAETICLKCLQKEPHKRYASALALADDLERFLEGRPIAARPITTWERAVKLARRRPGAAALLAGIVAVTLLGFAGTTGQWRVAERRRAEADTRRQEAETRSYFNRIALANHEWSAHNVVRANQLLNNCRKDSPGLCGWEWDLLKRRCNEHLLVLQGHTLDVRCVTYSSDGRLLASCSGEWNGTQPGEVVVWDAVSGKRLHTFLGHRAAVYSVAFHPDGRRLASAGPKGECSCGT
jgi:serine/threonine protein kinase